MSRDDFPRWSKTHEGVWCWVAWMLKWSRLPAMYEGDDRCPLRNKP